VENDCLEDSICHGAIANMRIKAGPYAGVIINGGIVVDQLCRVIELLQGMSKGSERVLVAAVI